METMLADLEADHLRFRRYLSALMTQMEALRRGDNPDYFLLNMLAEYFSNYPDELHHKKEDIIYAFLVDKAGNGAEPLLDIQAQHEALSVRARHFADVVRSIINDEQLPIGSVLDAARDYQQLLGSHIAAEDAALFGPALKQFAADDWDAVNDAAGDLYAEEINFDKARTVLELEQSIDEHLHGRAAVA